MKHTFSRRQILAQLAAAPISSVIGYDGYTFARSLDKGLTGVCVFAWSESKTVGRTVDLWTARCGSIDSSQLSDQPGRFIVWDDIISDRDEDRSIGAIKAAISHYFGIPTDQHEPNSVVHLGEIESVPKALDWTL